MAVQAIPIDTDAPSRPSWQQDAAILDRVASCGEVLLEHDVTGQFGCVAESVVACGSDVGVSGGADPERLVVDDPYPLAVA